MENKLPYAGQAKKYHGNHHKTSSGTKNRSFLIREIFIFPFFLPNIQLGCHDHALYKLLRIASPKNDFVCFNLLNYQPVRSV